MLRMATVACVLVVGLGLFGVAQEDAKKTDAVSRSASARKALAERIEIPAAFKERIKFRDVVAAVLEQLAARQLLLEVSVDQPIFRDAVPDIGDIFDLEVSFPPFVKSMTVMEVLETTIHQIGGTFLIKSGRVLIVPEQFGGVEYLIDQSIAIQLRGVTLNSAIEEVAEIAGVSIVVDPRCAEALNKPVNLQTRNDISARGILLSWADLADLKLVVDSHRVMLTPRVEYLKHLKDQVEEMTLMTKLAQAQGYEAFRDSPQYREPVEQSRRPRGLRPAAAH